MELNPNHEVTRAVSDQWHTIAALIMMKLDTSEVVITESDLLSISPIGISVQELSDGLHIKLVTMQEAENLARKNGGLLS